jgi:hypothetical protein
MPSPLRAPSVPGDAEGPEAGSPADIIRGLVLAAGGVTEPQAELLLRILDQLKGIESRSGRDAANTAARRIRAIWMQDLA